MSVVAVIGGTGTIGRYVVEALAHAGAEVRVLSRHSERHPVDVSTGEGLDAALAGCEVIVDAGNGPVRRPETVLVEGTRHILDASRRAGVGHLVTVSIVGIERMPVGYYRVKLIQERLVREGGVPWSIVRSTQFHELVDGWLETFGRWYVAPRVRGLLQPVAAREAGVVVARVASAEPRRGTPVTVAGPQIEEFSALAREWSRSRDRAGVPLPIPLPGRVRISLREGALTCPEPDERGVTTFGSWLSAPGGQEVPS